MTVSSNDLKLALAVALAKVAGLLKLVARPQKSATPKTCVIIAPHLIDVMLDVIHATCRAEVYTILNPFDRCGLGFCGFYVHCLIHFPKATTNIFAKQYLTGIIFVLHLSMKTDYELCIGFCEAEIESPQSEMFTVDEYANFYTISLPLPESAITIYKPSRASIFDKNRVSFGEGCQTPYFDLPIWSHVAHMLGLKSAWIACADRLPENGTWICSDGVDSFEARIRNGIAFVHDGCYQKARTYTHWQPLPAKP